MTNRTRNRTSVLNTGSYLLKRYNSVGSLMGIETAVPISVQSLSQTCIDHISPRPYFDAPLTLSSKRIMPPRLLGHIDRFIDPATHIIGDYSSYAGGALRNIANIPSIGLPATSYWKNRALANMNINETKVDLPNFLYELRDFPEMLHQLGRVLAKKVKPSDVPGGYLAYRFGWGPLFSDLGTLLNLADAVEDRKKEILAMDRNGGRRIARRLGGQSYRVPFGGTYNTFTVNSTFLGTVLQGTYNLTYTEYAWYTAREKLVTNISALSAKEFDSRVFRSLLGVDKPAASIWESLPWSWLVDYFYDVGSMLAANAGYFQYNVTSFNLMIKQVVSGVFESTFLYPQLRYTEGRVNSYVLNRTQPMPVVSPFAFRGFLSDYHKTLIGSLITAKALRAFHR